MMAMHWGGLWGWFLMIFSWIFIGWLVYRLIQFSNLGNSGNRVQDSPLEIAKKRYAAGEISSEDYHRIISDLAN